MPGGKGYVIVADKMPETTWRIVRPRNPRYQPNLRVTNDWGPHQTNPTQPHSLWFAQVNSKTQRGLGLGLGSPCSLLLLFNTSSITHSHTRTPLFPSSIKTPTCSFNSQLWSLICFLLFSSFNSIQIQLNTHIHTEALPFVCQYK